MRLLSGMRRIGLATTALVATGGLFAGAATNAYAGTVSGTNGTVTVVQSDGSTPMNTGGSASTFYISLSPTPGKPTADCSADSASGSTFVYSYAVHVGVDPTTLSYTSGHPAGTGAAYGTTAFGLFSASSYYGGKTTAPSTGQVQTDGVPFAWNPPLGSTHTSQLLYNGASSSADWNVGIACWNSATSTITDYWNIVVTFNPNANDSAGYTWTAANNPQQSVPEVPLPIVLPLGAAALIGGGVLFARRRRPTGPRAAA